MKKLGFAILVIGLGGGWLAQSAQAAETATFNSAADSYMDQALPTTNYGAVSSINVGVTSGNPRRGLFSFTITVPGNAAIKSGSMQIWASALGGGTLVGAYQVTNPWVENPVTWNKRTNANNWTTVGGDFSGTALDSIPNNVTSNGTNVAGWMTWNILGAVTAWYGGTANNGILLKHVNEGLNDNLVLRTKEFAGSIPYLTVTYLRRVVGLAATAGAAQVSLSWTNPGGSPYYSGTLIIRHDTTAPTWTGPTDGTVYTVGQVLSDGSVVVNNDSALLTSMTDTGLTPGTTYYYQAYARDSSNQYSLVSNSVVNATPTCPAVTAASWIAAQAQSGQATVYWSSGAGSVMVIEKPNNAFVADDYPTNGSTWGLDTAIGPNGAFVRYLGSATSAPRSSLTNNTTYYYQVFPYTGSGTGTCYAPAAAAAPTARPSSNANEAWSYMLAGGSALKPPIAGDNGIFFSSGAGQMISLNSTTGLPNWTPAATTSNVQGWLIPVPLSAGGSRVFAGDQGGKVYAVDTTAGSIMWQPALTGATAIQAGASVQLRAYSTGLPGTVYDLAYVATKNGAGSTNNKVFALRSDTGAVVWTFNDGSLGNNWSVGEINAMPALDYTRNRLYVTSMSTSGTGASLWIIDITTGQLVGNPASCPTASSACINLGDIDTAPNISYDGNTLWVGNKTESVYAIDLTAAPGPSMLKWTAPLALGNSNQLKGLVWEDFGTAGRLYMVVAKSIAANNTVRCFQDPGIGGTPNAAIACSSWPAPTVTINGAQAAIPLDKLYVTSWDGTTGRIQQIDFATGTLGTPFTLGDGTKQPGDVSTDLGSELFVGRTEGKIFKISLPIPP